MRSYLNLSLIPIVLAVVVVIVALLSFDRRYMSKYYDREVVISGTVVDSSLKDGKTSLRINDININYNTSSINCQVYVNLGKTNDRFARSDRIELRGILRDGFGSFSAYMYEPSILIHSKPDPPDFIFKAKELFIARINDLVGSPESSLALGYLVGDKSGMDDSLSEALRIAGLSHIVVASGFHLSVILELARKLFGKISRAAVIFGTTLFTVGFISVTGLSASIARAGLMSLMSLYAWYFGRKFHPFRLLLYAAAITLVIHPFDIRNVA